MAFPVGDRPVIFDTEADAHFNALARAMRADPADVWVGGYVEREWARARHLLDNSACAVAGKSVLEFGCNVGATSVVLAALGATVTAVDVDASILPLARLNARRYGLGDRITFLHVPDTTHLPFPDAGFDIITCNSVLEYVPSRDLAAVQRELHRVLARNGLVVVAGTSNRLWPREVHSGRWFTNYLPCACDRFLPAHSRPQRGVMPWHVRRGFTGYDDVGARNGHVLTEAKRRMGASTLTVALTWLAESLLHATGISAGMIMPSIYLTLRKPPV